MEHTLKHLLNSIVHTSLLKQVHSLIITTQPNLITIFTKKLLSLSFFNYARKVFNQIPQPDQTLCNLFLSSYTKHSLNKEAIGILISMHKKNTPMDFYTFPSVFKACALLLDVNLGKQVHSLVIDTGFSSSVFVQAALVDFYSKVGDLCSAKRVFDEILVKDLVCYNCLISGYLRNGDVVMARKIFDDMEERSVVSWNAMLSGYANDGDFEEGFRIFERMRDESCWPNEFTVATVLSLCAKGGHLDMGLRVKRFIDDDKNLGCSMVVQTALMEMYVKCGAVDEARREFDSMVDKDVVTWGTMIAGYAQNGRSSEALELFEKMRRENIQPTDVTLVSVLSACAHLGSVEAGEQIGNYVESLHGLYSNVHLSSALLSMYSKCGNMSKAQEVFIRMPQKDVVAWNSMIMGLAVNGFAEEAIAHYEEMKRDQMKPDEITFMGLLTACTHAGLLDSSLEFFRSMSSEHNIKPRIEHYACIVDVFCKSGKLRKAYNFVCKMEVEPNAVIWGVLLSASRIYSDLELAEISANKLIALEPENSGHYVLLSNIYASMGRWQESLKVRYLMKSKNLQKTAAYSWIELETMVHKFLVGDKSHPRSEEVYNIIDSLAVHTTWDTYEYDTEMEFSCCYS